MRKNVLIVSFILIILCFTVVQIKSLTTNNQNLADLNCEKETTDINSLRITPNEKTGNMTPFCANMV